MPPLRIVAHVHGYPPEHAAGAEWMLHDLLVMLTERGHICTVLNRIHTGGDLGTHLRDGVTVRNKPAQDVVREAWAAADVAVTHLDLTREAVALSSASRTPLVHLVHNDWQLRSFNVRDAPLVVFNSHHLAASARDRDLQRGWLVVHPPVPPRYRTTRTTGSYVTLLNLSREKGAIVLHDLARLDRQRRFLGVRGAYGRQVRVNRPNVTMIQTAADVRSVYQQTRVLLMPSAYESYGRCAVEAAWSGIPTVYNPTPGLVEGIGSGGMPVPLQPRRGWQKALQRLDEPSTYQVWSKRALRRAESLWADSNDEVAVLEKMLEAIA